MNDKTRTDIMKLSIELYEQGHPSNLIAESISKLYPGQHIDSIKFVSKSAIDMTRSFIQSVDKAGGSGWPISELINMTYLDLLSRLATNGVRFVFEKE